FDHPVKTDFRLAEERFIACGAGAENCANDAMRIEDREGERILSICGTVLNRQKLLFCESCGTVLGPAKYLDYIRKKTGSVAQITTGHALCEKCARKKVVGLDSSKPPGI
ncbi:MAG: 4Fe-4S ferredoxin, partial [Deltaproteobacteria bacterium]|nr:4Fe-4S ferredoxin [Deltaproteobacteria bacterium]